MGCKILILLQNITILLRHFPFNKTRGVYSVECGVDGYLGESFILLLCQRYYQTLRPDKNFRMYGNLILYLMRYTFRRVNLFLASAGQMYGRYLT